jgi:hypothetical protein
LATKVCITAQHIIGIRAHGSQLKSIKLTLWTYYATAEEHRAAVMMFNSQRQNEYNRRGEDQKERRANEIDSSLEHSIPPGERQPLIAYRILFFYSGSLHL